ncbi:glycoside hydrolase family 3 C-terminal domain-containing protein [Flavisolibacter nicotianae]|uniref:glycoside hydrolase family 3 C-terminal domain-containing protein n=1 Tax=Flavisolibacter nicotianae TaxID=2364882 RepID=UPI001F094FE7|nr:glycoside hydrolase family 3 C-terminal domain-containing protein [Flavisolibacter nicotianae]
MKKDSCHRLPVVAKTIVLAFFIFQGHWSMQASAQKKEPFRNSKLPVETRVKDLLSRLRLEEKAGLLGYNSKPVSSLAIPAYNWWNEGLHGVARAGKATVFPQAIALAATFNDSLIKAVGDVISTEARAKYNEAIKRNSRTQYMGLTFWSPNINIFRDPRWGRGQETYGEDPFLTAKIGSAFVQGMQGNDPHYLKAAACAKHFAVHSGPEATRHSFNAIVDEKDLRETYLYAFHKLVDAKVEAVMCAYNRLNGQPCCTNENLLHTILRQEWKFQGHILSDCWALDDIFKGHKTMTDPVATTAAAIKAGLNLDCSDLLQRTVLKAVQQGLLTEADVDNALLPTLRTQMKLGMYDAPSDVPFSKLNEADVHTTGNVQLARKAAQQSMVLLKNDNNILPIDKNRYKSLMVIGPNAASIPALVANYHGLSGDMVTFVEGITEAAGAGLGVQYDQGSDYTDTVHFGGIWAASTADLTIAVIGLTPLLEGEEGDAFLSASGGDKTSLDLPAPHLKLLQKLKANNKPTVVVVNAGSDVDIRSIEPYADAIILAWYPGEQGGNALADLLFGKISPSGRLPVTFYSSLSDLPAYDNYAMKGRTYRYYDGKVQYPFGFGLSYTTFAYAWKKKPAENPKAGDTLHFSVEVKNTGKMKGDEVVQVYVQYPSIERMPLKELKAFRRVTVEKNGSRLVSMAIPVSELQKWDLEQNRWRSYPGMYKLLVGPNSAEAKLTAPFRLEP